MKLYKTALVTQLAVYFVGDNPRFDVDKFHAVVNSKKDTSS